MWERRARLGTAAAKSIEDDILITDGGGEVLTAGTPKTVDEIERTCAETPRLPR